MLHKTYLAILSILISFCSAQLSGEEIVIRMNKNPNPSDIKIKFKMTLFSNTKKNKNKKHYRLMEQIEKRYEDGVFNSKLLLRFMEPKEVRGFSLLNWSWVGEKNDDQWLYIPKLRKTKRIRPSDKSRKFQGTEFTYSDFIKRDTNLDKYNLLGSDNFRGNKCFMVEANPINDLSYGVRILWIDDTDYLLRKIEFFDNINEKIKVLEIFDYVKNNQYWTPTKKIMKNLLNGSSTKMEVINVSYDQGLNDNLFSEKYLKRF